MVTAVSSYQEFHHLKASPALELHPLCPGVPVGPLHVVVAVPAVRGLGEVGAPLAALGVGLAGGEVLGDAHEHQLLGVVQGEGRGAAVGALGAGGSGTALGVSE